jgi:copper homeostasis protein
MDDLVFEICVDSVEGVVAAARAGADRVELCAGLIEGGITPSFGMIATAAKAAPIKVNVIIRPRGGDFVYSPAELEVMERDIVTAKQQGAAGIVLGLLAPDGTIDLAASRRLIAAARPLPVTFHRAFDMARDPQRSLDTLIELGVERLLTSGQEATALEGSALIAALVRQAAGRIVVMPGGGLTERTVARVVAETGARELHFAALGETASPMAFRNERAYMGGALRPPEYGRLVTEEPMIRAVMAAARAAGA